MNLRGPLLQLDASASSPRRGPASASTDCGEAVFTLPAPADPAAPRPRADAPARNADRAVRERPAGPEASRPDRERPRERLEARRGATTPGESAAVDAPPAEATRDTAANARRTVHGRPGPETAEGRAGPADAATAGLPATPPAARPPVPSEEATAGTDPAGSVSALADNVLAQLGLPALAGAPGPETPMVHGLPAQPAGAAPWTPGGVALAAVVTGMPAMAVPAPGVTPAPLDPAAAAPLLTAATATATTAQALPDPRLPQPGASLPLQAASPMPADAFAALAALAGSRDAASSEPLDLRAADVGLARSEAPLTPTGALLPGAPVRLTETATLASLGSIALPANPEAGFDDGFDQRIAWMVDQRITQAEMRVSPEGVGPIEVRLQIDGHRVSAQFNAANADVRQALEAGMDRLRDLLGQRGMELAGAQVGGQGTSRDPGGRGARGQAAGSGLELADGATTTVGPLLRARGLIDEYV